MTNLEEPLEKRSYVDKVDCHLSALLRIPVVEKEPEQTFKWKARVGRDARRKRSGSLVEC